MLGLMAAYGSNGRRGVPTQWTRKGELAHVIGCFLVNPVMHGRELGQRLCAWHGLCTVRKQHSSGLLAEGMVFYGADSKIQQWNR